MLTNSDIVELTAWRHELHRHPEVSREERQTAARVTKALQGLGADRVLNGLGGHGVAGIFDGAADGPTILFRAELDALPITEKTLVPYRSAAPGKGHLCGHDGHMALLMGLARLLARARPARGRVILIFQPAEEDGSGAAAVVDDAAFKAICPDWAFSIHNMPGLPFGQGALKAGVVNCASVGLKIMLTGKTAHASMPETGSSPAAAVARLIPALSALGPGGTLGPDYRLVTVTHANVGEPAFGIAPGDAELWVTLRTMADEQMADLRGAAMAIAQAEAQADGLAVRFTDHDDFAASVNDSDATARFAAALDALKVPYDAGDLPMRASEDFGRFGRAPTRAAMLFLGAGEAHPALHNPDYDFPDALIPLGVGIFHRVMCDLLG